jgi:hypothetical protein
VGLVAALSLFLVIVVASAWTPRRFPAFRFDRTIVPVAASGVTYDPTGESIFPSILHVAGRLADPLGAFYLYYAPHDAPGGISLAYADRPEGPWTAYAGNPVIAATWPPYYAVSHVSSPDAVFTDDGRLLLYFHGENDTTRVAASDDGIRFRHPTIAVSTRDLPGSTETSYARVSEDRGAAASERYRMIFMGVAADGVRRLYLATSADALDWAVRRQPLVTGTGDEGRDVSGGTLMPWEDGIVVYGTSSGDLYAADVGPGFDRERHLGRFFDDPDLRAAAPAFLEVDRSTYLFYERGPRLGARLALATAPEAP